MQRYSFLNSAIGSNGELGPDRPAMVEFKLDRHTVVALEEGDFLTVPRGVLHNPVAEEECWVLLIETVTTRHTGDVQMDQTRSIEEQLA